MSKYYASGSGSATAHIAKFGVQYKAPEGPKVVHFHNDWNWAFPGQRRFEVLVSNDSEVTCDIKITPTAISGTVPTIYFQKSDGSWPAGVTSAISNPTNLETAGKVELQGTNTTTPTYRFPPNTTNVPVGYVIARASSAGTTKLYFEFDVTQVD
ncbi:MAG: hypothetical protein LBG83_05175 [Oscillospiraceae bacterium]|nr:hypothetical protein [Oscillospiraceae bacterium]